MKSEVGVLVLERRLSRPGGSPAPFLLEPHLFGLGGPPHPFITT